jgi:hypothetical protein
LAHRNDGSSFSREGWGRSYSDAGKPDPAENWFEENDPEGAWRLSMRFWNEPPWIKKGPHLRDPAPVKIYSE